ncbi:MAG: hypothetical protein IKL07_00175 [Clostridium sp.]|nr:hypothetical protein [Clostridium sp.]
MKNIAKKFSTLLCMLALLGCFVSAPCANVMAYTVYDINEDEYYFDTTVSAGGTYKIYVTPYRENSTPEFYIRFTNYDDALFQVDVFDMDTRNKVFKDTFDDYRITVRVQDLEEDHEYRISIRNRSDFSAEISGRVF